ncbi:hypothetical protein [Reyranella sp.]|jgi:hypothetical protein|uniref:hypothetical protein n=1 Tax=Reyranella sp. TaxID=1929291 RepID=UPI002F943CBE
MRNSIAAVVTTALLAGSAAQAQQTAYTWTGMGTNVPGSSKCPTYKMTIDVMVEGDSVKGRFQQEGRPERHFVATKDAGGVFKGRAEVGGGTMDVTGVLKDGSGNVMLDGYCRFGGTLTRK